MLSPASPLACHGMRGAPEHPGTSVTPHQQLREAVGLCKVHRFKEVLDPPHL